MVPNLITEPPPPPPICLPLIPSSFEECKMWLWEIRDIEEVQVCGL